MPDIHIYTDGSCHTQRKVGAWAAIVLDGDARKELTGMATDTTHNRMELTAVIKAIECAVEANGADCEMHIYTDSQYVERLNTRRAKFEANGYTTKAGKDIQNADLVMELLQYNNKYNVHYHKVAAHSRLADSNNYNIDADMLCRQLMRSSL